MNRKLRLFVRITMIVCIGLFLFPVLKAQSLPLPYIKGATINPKVAFNSSTGIFTYQYIITNFPNSIGSISGVWFDIYLPKGAQLPSTQGLRDNIAVVLSEGSEQDTYQEVKGEVVPIAFTEAPSGWDGGYTGDGPAAYADDNPNGTDSPLQPGASTGPFVIQSHGIVGIRTFRFDPDDEQGSVGKYFHINQFTMTIPQMNKILAAYSQALRAVQFFTKSLAPTALPLNCDPACMVQFLLNEKEQAFQLGWITNAGVANSLDAKLNEAKKKLQEGETQVTINLLKSFILDLEAQHQGQTGQGQGASTGNAQTSRKHVTDNAYYLLKPNAEFILYKLGVTNFQ